MNNAAAIRAAGELLLSCGVAELPIDARKLLVSRGVKVMPYGKAKGEKKAALEKLIAIIGARDGFTIMDKSGRYTVMYSESGECAERIGFTLAHELAHIALNHEGALSAAGERLSREENEADAFARELLAPAALLLLLPKPLTDNDRLIFRLSNAAWKVRQQKAAEDRLLEGAELSARLAERFSPALLGRVCSYCGAGFSAASAARFCPICGSEEISRGAHGIRYSGIETDENGRAKRCPVCGCEDELTDDSCPLCGAPIRNRCPVCSFQADGSARYCQACGSPTAFYAAGFLSDWHEYGQK